MAPFNNANVKKWNGVNSLGGMAATGMWPTPVATDGSKMPSGSLSRAVRPDLEFSKRKNGRKSFIPTPAVQDGKGAGRRGGKPGHAQAKALDG